MIWVIAIATIVLILVAGILAGTMSCGDTNSQHLPSVVSRIIDWMF